jgi:hypothetical protein
MSIATEKEGTGSLKRRRVLAVYPNRKTFCGYARSEAGSFETKVNSGP